MPPRKTGGLTGDKMNIFGRKLRAMRHAKGVGLNDFVAKLQRLGWDIGAIGYSQMERGARTLTDSELMLALKILGARLSDLEK